MNLKGLNKLKIKTKMNQGGSLSRRKIAFNSKIKANGFLERVQQINSQSNLFTSKTKLKTFKGNK